MELEATSQFQSSLHTVQQSSEALTPVLQVLINGETELVKERVVSIKTTDEAGIMSDSCEIELDDFDDALPLPKTEAVISEYSCSFRETESGGAIGTVIANWYDKDTGEYHIVSAGSGDPEYELDEIFSSEKAALAAASAKFKRVVKSNKTLSFTTSGRPDFFAESPIVFQGFSSKIPTNWIISRVEHTLSASGFSTSVTCVNVV